MVDYNVNECESPIERQYLHATRCVLPFVLVLARCARRLCACGEVEATNGIRGVCDDASLKYNVHVISGAVMTYQDTEEITN